MNNIDIDGIVNKFDQQREIFMVTLNYREADKVIELCRRVSQMSVFTKIIVVDNCSGDGSVEKLKKFVKLFSNILLIESKSNQGYSAGYNQGLKYIIENYKSDFIFIINPDVVFDECLARACIDTHVENSEYGLISTRLIGVDGHEEIGAWKYPTYKQYLLFNFLLLSKIKRYSTTEKVNEGLEIMDVAAVRGSFLCFKTEAIKAAGFFDENVFLYNEENIISKKLHKVGYRIGLLTKWFYHHNHHPQISTNKIKRIYFMSNYYYQCHYNSINILQRILLRCSIIVGLVEKRIINFILKG